MSEIKHTPLPWLYEECKSGLRRPYEKFDILHRTPDCYANSYGINTGGRLRHIATVRSQASKITSEANARLIAAAPDLLEALENIIDHYNSKDGDMKLLRHFISEGEKSLSKAKGDTE